MKKLISILLVAMLVVTCLATVAFAAGSANLNISSVTAQAGDEVTISFTLSGDAFASYGLKINADSALKLTKITKGAASDGSFVGNVKNGIVTGAATYNTPAGELFTATFKVAEDAKPGKYAVNVSLDFVADEDGQDLGVTVNKGYVTIECEHSWGAWTEVEPATCKKVGKEERVCSKCGEKETRDIPKTSHSWGAWTEVEPATCKKVGKEERICSICGEKETRDIAKTQHSWSAWTQIEPPSCNKVGKEERTCSICGEKQTRDVGKTSHSWGAWTEVEPATCQKVGKEERVCSVCGEKETRDIAKTQHSWGAWTEVEPATCQKVGKEKAVCSVCGEEQERDIPKADHVPSAGYAYDDNQHWHVCSVCNEALTKEDHDLEWVITKEASKDQTGLKHEECKVCDYCGDDVVIPEYETGDNVPVICAIILAVLALLALVAYLLKRKFNW